MIYHLYIDCIVCLSPIYLYAYIYISISIYYIEGKLIVNKMIIIVEIENTHELDGNKTKAKNEF